MSAVCTRHVALNVYVVPVSRGGKNLIVLLSRGICQPQEHPQSRADITSSAAWSTKYLVLCCFPDVHWWSCFEMVMHLEIHHKGMKLFISAVTICEYLLAEGGVELRFSTCSAP